jgi:hypothetical protein
MQIFKLFAALSMGSLPIDQSESNVSYIPLVPNSTSIAKSTGDSGFLISTATIQNIETFVREEINKDLETICSTYYFKSNCPTLKWLDMYGDTNRYGDT